MNGSHQIKLLVRALDSKLELVQHRKTLGCAFLAFLAATAETAFQY